MKKIKYLWISLLLVLSFSCTANAKTLLEGTKTLSSYDSEGFVRGFTIPKKGVVAVHLYFCPKDSLTSDGKMYVDIWNKEDYTSIIKESGKYKKDWSESFCWYLYSNDDKTKPGEYWLDISKTDNADSIKVKYKVSYYPYFSTSLKSPKTVNIKTDQVKRYSLKCSPDNSYLGDASVESSNTKVAEAQIELDETNMNKKLYIWAKKQGTCTITITTQNKKKIKIKVIVKDPSTPKLTYTDYTMCRGETVNNSLKFAKKKVYYSSSNNRIATVSQNGKITAQSAGNCFIYAKCGGKTYKCKVTVQYRNPNFGAVLNAYYTRDNYFTVKFKNNGEKPLTILPTNAKVEEDNYKTWDRYLRLPGNRKIVINPGKTKTVRFYVKGSVTWYDYEDYTLIYNFSYDNKTYVGHVWYCNSSYQKGKKWYNTYWTTYEDWYSSWY